MLRTYRRVPADQIVAIRKRYASGETMASLASHYSVALTTIEFIVRGRNWRHEGGPISTTERGERHRGERHWKCKLTDEQVAQIKREYASGARQMKLAAQFGVGQTHISRIVRGENRASV